MPPIFSADGPKNSPWAYNHVVIPVPTDEVGFPRLKVLVPEPIVPVLVKFKEVSAVKFIRSVAFFDPVVERLITPVPKFTEAETSDIV